jgi:hypothetical protein
MTSGDKHPVSTFLEGLDDKVGRDPATAHYPDGTEISSILEPHASCQIGAGITAPVAAEGNDLGFKTGLFSHTSFPDGGNGEHQAHIIHISFL